VSQFSDDELNWNGMERTESDHREIRRPGGESYIGDVSRTKAEAFLASTIRNHDSVPAITHLLPRGPAPHPTEFVRVRLCHRSREIKLIKTQPQATASVTEGVSHKTRTGLFRPHKNSGISEPKDLDLIDPHFHFADSDTPVVARDYSILSSSQLNSV